MGLTSADKCDVGVQGNIDGIIYELTLFTIIMEKSKEIEKKENSKPHFAKNYNYAPNESWRTDFAIGKKGSKRHGHLTLSGSWVWYLRDELGEEIIVDGKVNNEQVQKVTAKNKLIKRP